MLKYAKIKKEPLKSQQFQRFFLAEKEGFEPCKSVDIATFFAILRCHYDSLVIQQFNRPLQKLRHTDSLFVPVQRNPFCKLRFHLNRALLIRLNSDLLLYGCSKRPKFH